MENVADACGYAGGTAAGHVSGAAAREEAGATSLNSSAADAGGSAKGGGLSGGPAKVEDAGGGVYTQEQPGAISIVSRTCLLFIVLGPTLARILKREEGAKEWVWLLRSQKG